MPVLVKVLYYGYKTINFRDQVLWLILPVAYITPSTSPHRPACLSQWLFPRLAKRLHSSAQRSWQSLSSTYPPLPRVSSEALKGPARGALCPYLSRRAGESSESMWLPLGRSWSSTELGEGTGWAAGGRKGGGICVPRQIWYRANRNTILFPKKFKALYKH